MIDGSEKRNRQLAFELQNSHVCEKRSKMFISPCPSKLLFQGLNTTLESTVIMGESSLNYTLSDKQFWPTK